MHTARVPGDLRGQKRAFDLVELEVMMVVSPHGGARNGTWLLCKCPKPLSYLSSLPFTVCCVFI